MNPAVTKLFEQVENPIIVQAALQALATREPLAAETLPADLLEPIFILTTASQEMKGPSIVDDPAKLRERLREDGDTRRKLCQALLFDGASFNAEPRKFPEAASMNCEAGEVKLHYLPDGARFEMCGRQGQLIYRTPSRAVIEITGTPKQKTFKNHQAGGVEGVDVTITTSGRERTGCSLDAPVKPIFLTVQHEDRVWAINAWKEVTGVFEEEESGSKSKVRSRR